jgi:hypothetical protein
MKTAVKKTDDWANFILRRIENGVETDTMLGGFYSYIEKEKSPEVFNELTKEWDTDDLKDCYAVITFFEESFMPLYEGSNYYVMTDTGGTVANRTKK